MVRIIYPMEDGGVAVIIPSDGCELSVDEIARKDVPQGIPYNIVEDDAVPVDRTFRAAWEADFSEPDGHGDPEGWRQEAAA